MSLFSSKKIYVLVILLIVLFCLNLCLSYLTCKVRDPFDNLGSNGSGSMKVIEATMDDAKNLTGVYDKPVIFHCYWDGQLNEKQMVSMKSCYHFNVLNKPGNKIILWTPEIHENEWTVEAKKYVSEIRVFTLDTEVVGTPMENIDFSKVNMSPSFFSDVVRYTLLYKYGGCWFDLDVFFLRSMDPLFAAFENDIVVYQWDNQNYPNGAVFVSLVPYSEKMKKNIEYIGKRGQGWGFQEAELTFDMPLDFVVLPCGWFDPYWREDNPYGKRMDDFFKAGVNGEVFTFDGFDGAFTFHWHNRWGMPVEDGSPFQQLNSLLG